MASQKFPSRSDTRDCGGNYEFLMSAYYGLRLSLTEAVSDFKLSTNNEDMGNFDDVVLEITYSNGEQHLYALQLKHRNAKNDSIGVEAFDSEKGGNFSLKKYCEGFKNTEKICRNNGAYSIPFENFHFVLYTNQLLSEFHTIDKNRKTYTDEFQLKSKITIYKYDKCVAKGLLDLSETDSYFIYKFRNNPEGTLDQQFLDQFVLYTKQKDVHEIERNISRFINELFVNCNSSVVVNYINFFKFWWRGDFANYKLTKRDVMLKLTEYVLTTHIPELTFERLSYEEEKIFLLKECFDNFDLTVVKNLQNLLIQEIIWEVILKEHFGDRDLSTWSQPFFDLYKDFFPPGTPIPISAQGDNSTQHSLKSTYITLWHMDKLPLFIKVSHKARKAIYAAIKLCENHEKKKKFIILDSNFDEEEFSEEISIFQDLSNLLDLDVYVKISNHVKISLQGRQHINFHQLAQIDRRFHQVIEVDEIIQMLDNNFIIGDNCKKSLPKHYVTRFCPKLLLNSNVVDEIKDDIFVISCPSFAKLNFKRKTCDLNKYLLMKQNASVQPFSEKVIILVSGICSEESFRNICILNEKENCHHVKTVGKNVVEWIESRGSINSLRQYRLDLQNVDADNFVTDLNLLEYFSNKMNAICAAPGMGKSVLLKFLKYNCPSNFWVVAVNLNDHIKFFKDDHQPLEIVNHLLENDIKDDFCRSFINIFATLRKILFLWDGFDELPSTCIHSVASVMKKLHEEGFRQWIAARVVSKEFLENTFSLLSIAVTPFSEEDQQQYVYHQLKEKFEDEDKVREMALKLNQNMSSSLNCGYFDYSRIPLQIYMVMEIFLKKPEKYLEQFKILVLTDVYHEFIEGKFDDLFKRAQANTNNRLMQKIKNKFKEAQSLKYETAALKASFDGEIFASLNLNCDKFLQDVAGNGDSLGLIVGLNEDNKPIFTHKTYEEFLAASWLVQNHRNFPKLVDLIFQDDYGNIRLMFDMILAKDSPVHIGVIYKNMKILEEHEEIISACKDKGGRNPLQIACSWGLRHPLLDITCNEDDQIVISGKENIGNPDDNIEMIKLLLDHGCNPLEKDKIFGMNSVEYSDQSRSLACLEVILSKRYPINLKELRNFNDVNTLFYYCVEFNYPNLFQLSDYPYVEVVVENEEPRTLLQFAVLMDRTDFVHTLLTYPQYKEVINKPYRDVGGPLLSAAKNGNLEMFNVLRQNGAELDQNQFSPLIIAAELGYTEFCRKLLTQENIDPNQIYVASISALQAAASRNYLDIMRLLLHHGAKVNYVNYLDHTALDFCIDNASFEGVELLIKFGADVNRQANTLFGYTPLHNACEKDNEEIIKLLLKSGADPTIKSHRMYTPLHVALINRHENVAKILIQADPSVINEYSEEKSTPLMLAALENYHTTIEILAKLGADMDSMECKDSPLRIATLKKFEKSVATLIECGASVNKPDEHGFTPLFYAIISEHILKLFLDNPSTDVNARSTNLVTALHFAAQNEKIHAVKELIEHEADIDAKDWKSRTPLHYAVTVKNVDVVDCLLKNNPKLDNVFEYIRIACVKDAPDCLLSLLNHGIDVNVKDNEGRSGLHFASGAGSLLCVKVLLMKGAEIDSCDDHGFSPLCFAALSSSIDIIRELLHYGADVTKGFGSASALHLSARTGDFPMLVFLISIGCNLDAQDETGMTPLHCALEKTIGFVLDIIKSMEVWEFKFQSVTPDFQNCARELVEKGADVSIRNKLGWSSLAAAGLYNNLSVITTCFERFHSRDDLEEEWQKCMFGAALKNATDILGFFKNNNLSKINGKDQHHMTALHYACAGGAFDASVYLIDNGADVNAPNVQGSTPLQFAANVGKLDLVKLLVEHGAQIDTPNEHGNTSLFGAASRGFVDVVAILYEHGAGVNVVDEDGDTPLHDAAAHGHVEVVRYLVSKDAVVNVTNKNGKLPIDLARDTQNSAIVEILERSSLN